MTAPIDVATLQWKPSPIGLVHSYGIQYHAILCIYYRVLTRYILGQLNGSLTRNKVPCAWPHNNCTCVYVHFIFYITRGNKQVLVAISESTKRIKGRDQLLRFWRENSHVYLFIVSNHSAKYKQDHV